MVTFNTSIRCPRIGLEILFTILFKLVGELLYSRSDGVLTHFLAYIYRYFKFFFSVYDNPYMLAVLPLHFRFTHIYNYIILFCHSTAVQTHVQGADDKLGQTLWQHSKQ
jgi:hypothetical protein